MSAPVRRRLLQNALHIPSEDLYLKSAHVHDYVVHRCKDGSECMVDGGREYLRRSVNPLQRDFDLYEDDSFDLIADRLLWGTYGRKKTYSRFVWVPLKDCTTEHLQAILTTQHHVKGTLIERVCQHWLDQRYQAKMAAATTALNHNVSMAPSLFHP